MQLIYGGKDSLTGRDGYIVAKALYQACKWQEALKKAGNPRYEWSDHQDMKAILTGVFGQLVPLLTIGDPEPADLTDGKVQ